MSFSGHASELSLRVIAGQIPQRLPDEADQFSGHGDDLAAHAALPQTLEGRAQHRVAAALQKTARPMGKILRRLRGLPPACLFLPPAQNGYGIDSSEWPKSEYRTLKNCLAGAIRAGVLTIYPGYAWDGMTCAPDWCLEASLIHDFCCQARTCKNFRLKVSQLEVDKLFRDTMIEKDFILWPVYYFAVRVYQIVREQFVKYERPQLIETLL